MSAFLPLRQHTLLAIALLACSFTLSAANLQGKLPERLSQVKVGNQHVVLLGTPTKLDAAAPNFKVVDSNFKTVQLSDFKHSTVLISVVPSIDTGVCSLQTKRFNSEVANLPSDIVLLTISTDLPFAQKRYCQQENIDKLTVLSDSVWRDFGIKYGLLIKDMGLLSRAVLIIDKQGKLAYEQIVTELTQEPDYEAVLKELHKIIAAH